MPEQFPGAALRLPPDRARDEFHRDFLLFEDPFADREELAARFDTLFEGTEAILLDDQADYRDALDSVSATSVTQAGRPGRPRKPSRAGKLLADDYLIPMPTYAGRLTRYDRALGVQVIDGEYDDTLGLIAVRGPEREHYRPGEVI